MKTNEIKTNVTVAMHNAQIKVLKLRNKVGIKVWEIKSMAKGVVTAIK